MFTHAEMVQRITEAIGLSTPPIAIYYSETRPEDALVPKGKGHPEHICHLMWLNAVATGRSMALDAENYGCGGAGRYCGFELSLREGFDYFLSTGIPGKFEGEHYKKTPELVRTLDMDAMPAAGPYCVYERLDRVCDEVKPEVVVFIESGHQLSGLFTLANYGRPGRDNVVCPFCSGCGALVCEPRLRAAEGKPAAVLGCFDVSARPGFSPEQLSFSVPFDMLVQMVEDIPGSFLDYGEWAKVRRQALTA